MDVGEREYDDGDGDVCGRSYVCARMEVWTLTRQKDIYSTLTRQKGIYLFLQKKQQEQVDVVLSSYVCNYRNSKIENWILIFD